MFTSHSYFVITYTREFQTYFQSDWLRAYSQRVPKFLIVFLYTSGNELCTRSVAYPGRVLGGLSTPSFNIFVSNFTISLILTIQLLKQVKQKVKIVTKGVKIRAFCVKQPPLKMSGYAPERGVPYLYFCS